jgi:hypothetical protein
MLSVIKLGAPLTYHISSLALCIAVLPTSDLNKGLFILTTESDKRFTQRSGNSFGIAEL